MRTSPALLLLLLPLIASQEEDGMFTSSTDLNMLLDTEAELVDKLNTYVNEEEIRIEKLKKLVKNYQTMRDNAEEAGDKFVGNPLNSFLLIKKLTSDWKQVQGLIQNSVGSLSSFTSHCNSCRSFDKIFQHFLKLKFYCLHLKCSICNSSEVYISD